MNHTSKEHNVGIQRCWNQIYLLRYSRSHRLRVWIGIVVSLGMWVVYIIIRASRSHPELAFQSHPPPSIQYLPDNPNIDQASTIAIVLPIHQQKFKFLYSFYKDLVECPAASQNIHYYLLFSNLQEQDSFWNNLPHAPPPPNDDDVDSLSSKFTNLIVPEWTLQNYAQGDKAQGSTIPIAKKWWGMAYLLDHYPQHPFDFIIAMDAETKITNCQSFETQSIVQGLIQKYQTKQWIAGPMQLRNKIQYLSAELATIDSMRLFKLYEMTHEWKIYSWWTDIPWYERQSVQEMVDSWGTRIPDRSSEELDQWKHDNPTQYYQRIVQEFNPAHSWYLFEHIVYQSYMVAFHDFEYILKTPPHEQHHCAGAILECDYANDSDVKPDWSPLWVPATMADYIPPTEEDWKPFYLFHTDRFVDPPSD